MRRKTVKFLFTDFCIMKILALPDDFMLTPKQVATLTNTNLETVLDYIRMPASSHSTLKATAHGTGSQKHYEVSLADFCEFCTKKGLSYQVQDS